MQNKSEGVTCQQIDVNTGRKTKNLTKIDSYIINEQYRLRAAVQTFFPYQIDNTVPFWFYFIQSML